VNGKDVTVAEKELGFEFRGKHMPKIAVAFTQKDECSIVYANGAASAESLAEDIAGELPQPAEPDAEVQDLIEFIREHVHPKYRLAGCLERGVAFHYGRMPQIVRARVEDLLKKRALHFVCCTSTLLQGVNLPAKNIFIENPKRGKGKPMRPGDFWNLAGRAGRLKREFHGNVWCVYGKDWDDNPRESDRLGEVTSAFTRTLETQPERVLNAIKSPEGPAEAEETQLYEQAFGRVFSDFSLEGRSLTELRNIPESKRGIVAEIEKSCASIVERATLPSDAFARNATISPLKLEALATFLKHQSRLGPWVPAVPMTTDGYSTMKAIFGKLEDIFFHEGNQSYLYYCWLASRWIGGSSLKDLIKGKLDWEKVPDEAREISTAIRKLFDELETTLRFKYVKYLRAYNDVLRAVLEQRGEPKLAQGITPLHLMIEYGAYDQTLINLMALGMSRTSAILMKATLHLPSNMSRAECQARINTTDLKRVDLPLVCKDEVMRIRRT
jgi:hypothetical protein